MKVLQSYNYRELRMLGRSLAMFVKTHPNQFFEDDCYHIFEKMSYLHFSAKDINTIIQSFEHWPK